MSVAAYKRIMLKLSGEALMGDDAYGINEGVVGVLRISIAYSRSPLLISRSIKKFSQLYPLF